MRSLLALPCLLAIASAFHLNPLTDEGIHHINNELRPNWVAGRNFDHHDLGRLKGLACVNVSANGEYMRSFTKKDVIVREDLPKKFDAREKWTKCPSIGDIRDQGNCGSCWAFATAESITDRICINGLDTVRISSEDILACCEWCGSGCGGGYPAKAWQYYVQTGVVTGGSYASRQGCMPYTIPPTGSSSDAPTPKCTSACIKSYSKSYNQDKHKGKNTYAIEGVKKAMQEIVDNGPVTAVFTLYQDFYTYKSGVYRHTSGYQVGGHVIKLIGFGTEGGDDYWLAVNSWNSTWGDNGLFKILRGANECGIEDYIAAGEPAVETLLY